jgi:hypothetical protein
MNKTISLAAIAMVAVIMGLSAFAPAAMADRPTPGEQTAVCHFDRDTNDDGDETLDDRAWEVLTPNNHGATHGHQGHGDDLIVDSAPGAGETTEALCLAEDHADPDL